MVNHLVADKADHDRTEEGGSNHKEPVAGDVDGEGRVGQEALDRFIGQALKQRVGARDHQVGGEACLCAGITGDHTDNRMLADAHVDDSRHWRNDDHRGIGSDVADGADKGDDIGNDGGRNIFQAAAEHRHDHAGLFTEPDSQRHGDDQAKRCKTGEVLDEVVEQPLNAFPREEVFGADCLMCGGVFQRDSGKAEDCTENCDDYEEIAEQDRGRRKLVTNSLDAV